MMSARTVWNHIVYAQKHISRLFYLKQSQQTAPALQFSTIKRIVLYHFIVSIITIYP